MNFVLVSVALAAAAPDRPRIGLDDFFDFVKFAGIKVAPDGDAVAIATVRPDWKRERFRRDLWLWRDGAAGLTPLTSSGRDGGAEWSPDGKWIAFRSDRPAVDPPPDDTEARGRRGAEPEGKAVAQVYAIPLSGGEAIPVTRGREEVHAFAWSPDSRSIWFATRIPQGKARRDAQAKEWKDTVRFREQERGDAIARIDVAEAIARHAALGRPDAEGRPAAGKDGETAETPGSVPVARTPWRVREIAPSPDGTRLAFATDPVSGRMEGTEAYEVYLVAAGGGDPRAVTRNEAVEESLRWTPDGKCILFGVDTGSAEGKYEEVQGRVYSVDADTGRLARWAERFPGHIVDWAMAPDGSLVLAGRIGTEVGVYAARGPAADPVRAEGWPGTYESVAAARRSPRVAVVHSSLERPAEVYLADGPEGLRAARPITSLNRLFADRALPAGRTFRWTADDGADIEGMLVYPPGRLGERKLRTLVLIHGGPGTADGNRFAAGWYDWGILAASEGWLVFRPNYRGSAGYGDAFMRQISPRIVSRPGRDILEGLDALVREGIADPEAVSIGGYSYGGYLTNWLITQRRFRAAVTGAGAVEHAANWGNDDLTFDDAWYLGGPPWAAAAAYNEEAALWRLDRVATPTHMVAGGDDVRVNVLESYLLERALHLLGVPSTLLIFPGEGHSLSRNPWHGKIKVREELKWLEKYGGGKSSRL